MGSPTYTYDPISSPWSKNFLITSWLFQTIYTSLLSIITGVIFSKRDVYGHGTGHHPYDDGYFRGISILTLFCTPSFAIAQIIFFIPQIIRYRQNRLHPLGVLIMAICSEILWFVVFSLAVSTFVVPWSHWNGYSLLMVFHAFILIPGTVHLVYASQVYRRYKNARKDANRIDLENLENFERNVKI